MPLPSLRGGIYARDGSPLALSVPTDDVIADDFQIAHPVKTARRCRRCSTCPSPRWRRSCTEHSGYVVLAKQLSQTDRPEDHSRRLPGITLVADSKRSRDQRQPGLAGRRLHQRERPGCGRARVRRQPVAGGRRRQGDHHGVAGGRGPAAVAGDGPLRRRRAPEWSSRSTPSSSTSPSRRWRRRSSRRMPSAGRPIVMDVKTGQILSMANLDATHPAALGGPTATATIRHGGVVPDRPERCGQRGPEQPGRDPALRAGLGVQAGDVLGRAARGAHQSRTRSSPCPTR